MEQRVLGGRYLLKDKVGTGGMATVFRAQDQVLDRTVAVKIMLPQYAGDATFAARFKQEAQAAAGLSSPYIVGVYDWGKDGDTYYIVMEYLRGTDLKSGIKSHGALDPKKVAQIGSQISSALSVAHKHEIIHRDIKPQNIMVLPDGNIKVMDFGIARAKNSHLTQDNNVLGTAHYVSPEQTRGQDLGPTSDIYSLGVVMYECATGRVPFDGDDAISVALKQVNELPIPPSQINSGVDADLERIILKCMEKDPANRFQTADELRQVLNSYLSGRAVNVSEPTRIIGAPGELGATKTRELSDQTRAMVRPVSGVSGQNTARSSVSGSTGSYESKSPNPTRTRSSPPWWQPLPSSVSWWPLPQDSLAASRSPCRCAGQGPADCRRADQGSRPRGRHHRPKLQRRYRRGQGRRADAQRQNQEGQGHQGEPGNLQGPQALREG